MASDIRLSTNARNAVADALVAQIGANALIDIYSGTKPAGPNTAVTSQVKLATVTGASTFAPASVAGVATANAIANGTGTVGASTGTVATWFRANSSGGAPAVDGTVGLTGCDMNINNTSIATGQTVAVSSCTITAPNA